MRYVLPNETSPMTRSMYALRRCDSYDPGHLEICPTYRGLAMSRQGIRAKLRRPSAVRILRAHLIGVQSTLVTPGY